MMVQPVPGEVDCSLHAADAAGMPSSPTVPSDPVHVSTTSEFVLSVQKSRSEKPVLQALAESWPAVEIQGIASSLEA